MYEVEEPVNISQLEASEDTVDFHREDTPICTGESADRNDAAAGEAPQIAGGNVSTELASAILKQVEFYFGDTNLPTDEFLLQHVKKSPQGWVNLNLIARFKRMKALTTSVPTIAEALQNSEFLVVSSDGKAVRRKNPLPKIDEAEASSRTVVAENLPAEAHGIDALTELFSKCGTVRMVRVCQPGEVKSVLQREASGRGSHGGGKQSLTVSNQVHALVEFSSAEEAAAACRELTDDSSWRSGLKVHPLVRAKRGGQHPEAHHHEGRNKPKPKPAEDGGAKQDAQAKGGKAAGAKGGKGGKAPTDSKSDALSAAKKAAQTASEGLGRGRSRRQSMDDRRKGSGAGSRGNRRSFDLRDMPSQKERKAKGSNLADAFATAPSSSPPQPGAGHEPLIKMFARGLQDEMTSSGAETSSGGEDGDHHGHNHKGRRKPKKDYASWASGCTAAAHHHHNHNGVHEPTMPDGTRGFTMGRGRPLSATPQSM